MNANLILKKRQEDIEVARHIDVPEAIKLIRKIEDNAKLDILTFVEEVKSEKMDSCSLNKDNPNVSVYIGGTTKRVIVKIRSEGKVAEMSIPKDTDTLTKR